MRLTLRSLNRLMFTLLSYSPKMNTDRCISTLSVWAAKYARRASLIAGNVRFKIFANIIREENLMVP